MLKPPVERCVTDIAVGDCIVESGLPVDLPYRRDVPETNMMRSFKVGIEGLP